MTADRQPQLRPREHSGQALSPHAALAGAFVAVRPGGWRGLLGLLAFASVPLIRALTYL